MISPSKPLERKLLEIGNLPQPPDEEDADLPMALRERVVDDVSRTSLSAEQVRTVLDINKALKNKQIDHDTAVALVASALGIASEQARVLVPEPPDETEMPVPPPPVPPAPPQAEPEESEEDENEEEDEEEEDEEDDAAE